MMRRTADTTYLQGQGWYLAIEYGLRQGQGVLSRSRTLRCQNVGELASFLASDPAMLSFSSCDCTKS